MQTILDNLQGRSFIECLPGGETLSSEKAALDLVAACGENGVYHILINQNCLSPDFFDLRTGLLGVVLLKFTTYHIIAAMVVQPDLSQKGRFGEFVLETNRGGQFRVFPDREGAVNWLINNPDPY